MSRFQGYVGIANHMGARFTASEQALAPVLRETAQARADLSSTTAPRRAASPARSPAPTTCRSPRPTWCSTRCRRRPRSTARWRGSKRWRASAAVAVGIAAALPVSIDRIAQWAKAAESRGIAAGADHRGRDQAEVELSDSASDAEVRHAGLDPAMPRHVAMRHDEVPCPNTKTCPIAPASASWCSTARACVFVGRRTDGPEHVDDDPRLADAAGRHRRRRGALSGGAARAVRGNQHPLGREARRDQGVARPTTFRARSRGKAWKGKYRGQTQKWYALRFTGNDSEIDIEHPGGGHEPEFVEWRWEPMAQIFRTWWCRSSATSTSGW